MCCLFWFRCLAIRAPGGEHLRGRPRRAARSGPARDRDKHARARLLDPEGTRTRATPAPSGSNLLARELARLVRVDATATARTAKLSLGAKQPRAASQSCVVHPCT
jgi:hypothetical protein